MQLCFWHAPLMPVPPIGPRTMFWLVGFLEVFVPWIILYKCNRSNSFVIVFTCSIAFQWYQTWYGNNYLNLTSYQAGQKKGLVIVNLHRATLRDVVVLSTQPLQKFGNTHGQTLSLLEAGCTLPKNWNEDDLDRRRPTNMKCRISW